jgi:hypothetical protein
MVIRLAGFVPINAVRSGTDVVYGLLAIRELPVIQFTRHERRGKAVPFIRDFVARIDF